MSPYKEDVRVPIRRSVDLDECETSVIMYRQLRCQCRPLCAVCGFPKHVAAHAPAEGGRWSAAELVAIAREIVAIADGEQK